MSDTGSTTPINAISLTFDAASASLLPQSTVISTGVYKPTDYALGYIDSFPSPAPTGSYQADLSVFNGVSPNGIWKVYVFDDLGGDFGKIQNGVSLTITTGGNTTDTNTPPVITSPGAQTSIMNRSVSLQIKATDANAGDVLKYSATGLPPNLSINATTGLISGTATTVTGNYTAQITVSDGHPNGISKVSFPWKITAGSAFQTQTFTSPDAIIIPNMGAASPYPANVSVNGMTGSVNKVSLTLNGLSHVYPADLDILLVGPGGQKSLLMSDAGDTKPINAISLTFDAASAAALPQSAVIKSGVYKPTDYAIGPADSFPVPAPIGPYQTDLSVFNGASPNGIWKVYVFDDVGGDFGKIQNGISLKISTQ